MTGIIPKLFVVDDSAEITDTLEACLSHKYNICVFNNPIKALEAYKKDSDYFALIVDINMPEMNGVELSQKIVKINPKQPIIILTGYTDPKNIAQAMKIESLVRIIKKPCDLNDLMETIEGIGFQ
ncbi:MAG: hypothetical protein COA79_25500 [Planctomycetota bacterium]|nr:MAG: hypothetical protein COA79_25500 [Planctomycetota bacterium]